MEQENSSSGGGLFSSFSERLDFLAQDKEKPSVRPKKTSEQRKPKNEDLHENHVL